VLQGFLWNGGEAPGIRRVAGNAALSGPWLEPVPTFQSDDAFAAPAQRFSCAPLEWVRRLRHGGHGEVSGLRGGGAGLWVRRTERASGMGGCGRGRRLLRVGSGVGVGFGGRCGTPMAMRRSCGMDSHGQNVAVLRAWLSRSVLADRARSSRGSLFACPSGLAVCLHVESAVALPDAQADIALPWGGVVRCATDNAAVADCDGAQTMLDCYKDCCDHEEGGAKVRRLVGFRCIGVANPSGWRRRHGCLADSVLSALQVTRMWGCCRFAVS